MFAVTKALQAGMGSAMSPDLNTCSKDLECQNFEIICKNKKKTVLVLNLYRPPQRNVENFVSLLDTSLQNVDFAKKKKKKHFVILTLIFGISLVPIPRV